MLAKTKKADGHMRKSAGRTEAIKGQRCEQSQLVRTVVHERVCSAQHVLSRCTVVSGARSLTLVLPSFRSKLCALKCRKAYLKELLSKMNLPYGKIQSPAPPVRSSEEALLRNICTIGRLTRSL